MVGRRHGEGERYFCREQLQLNDSALEGLKNEFIYGQVWYTGGVSGQALASREVEYIYGTGSTYGDQAVRGGRSR